jgi:hypothetical protein
MFHENESSEMNDSIRPSDQINMDIDALMETLNQQREEEKTTQVLKRKDGPFEVVKEELRLARKDKMRTVEHYLCDHCDCVINPPKLGFVIQGNIYVADPNVLGGLIGNNFPDQATFSTDAVRKTVLCRKCFLLALSFTS